MTSKRGIHLIPYHCDSSRNANSKKHHIPLAHRNDWSEHCAYMRDGITEETAKRKVIHHGATGPPKGEPEHHSPP